MTSAPNGWQRVTSADYTHTDRSTYTQPQLRPIRCCAVLSCLIATEGRQLTVPDLFFNRESGNCVLQYVLHFALTCCKPCYHKEELASWLWGGGGGVLPPYRRHVWQVSTDPKLPDEADSTHTRSVVKVLSTSAERYSFTSSALVPSRL